jgi:hypothetical protein
MSVSDPLELRLTVGAGALNTHSLPVRMGFVNRGPEPVRLLAEFEPLPVFFTFELVATDGTPIAMPGGGKIDFGPGQPRCIDLGPGETHTTEANVGRLLPGGLEPGRYSMAVTYHNQYTDDCFRGVLHSNPVVVDLATD